jgi:hypothetical protein
MEACEVCGFVWESVGAEEIPRRVVVGASEIAELVLGEPVLAVERPSPDRWSMVEYASHVRDVLVNLRDRFVVGLVEENPSFKPLYRDQRVDLGLYATDAADLVAAELEVAAGLFARTFGRLDQEQLARPCRYSFPAESQRTLLWMGQQAVHEVEHHRGDVAEDLLQLRS